MRPGHEVTLIDEVVARGGIPTTGTAFVVGLSDKGPAGEPISANGLRRAVRVLGERVNYGYLYDAADILTREGGSTAYFSRVVGPGALPASVDITDGVAPTISVEAKDVGEYGNALNVDVLDNGDDATIPVGSFVLVVTHDDDGELERSPVLATTLEAVDWGENVARYVNVVEEASAGDPSSGSYALAGGTDDRVNITNQQWVDAIDALPGHLGPGQIIAPGQTNAVVRAALLAHAAERNRVALLDPVNGATVDALAADASALHADVNARYGALFAPWVRIPGVTRATTRVIPPSILMAGMIAREDKGGIANVAVAGDFGRSESAIGLLADFTESEGQELNEAGVNHIRQRGTTIENYGYRTLVDPDGDLADYIQLSAVRQLMQIKAQAGFIAARHVFGKIDGRGRKFGQLEGDLYGMLDGYWANDALFGETADEAYRVETGADINPPEQIQDGILDAALAVRVSPFAELVRIYIAKRPVSERV